MLKRLALDAVRSVKQRKDCRPEGGDRLVVNTSANGKVINAGLPGLLGKLCQMLMREVKHDSIEFPSD